MTTITLELPEDAAAKAKTMSPEALAALIRNAALPDTAPDKPKHRAASLYGKGKGKVWMSDDFDAPLDDFKKCM